MIPNSLRFRLLGAAVIVILVAVQIAGVVLLVLFERNVLRLVHSELDAAVEQQAKFLGRDQDGRPQLINEPAQAAFRQRFSGRYWQISGNGTSLLRSRSLGDAELDTKSLSTSKQEIWHQPVVGPDKQQLYAAVRRVVLPPVTANQASIEYLLIAAMDVAEIRALDALNGQLRGDVLTALGLLAMLLILAAWAQVQVGLSPLEVLRTGLQNIRVGKTRRLSNKVPSELQPLVDETNRLLEAQENAIGAARARAGDLAHGIKTPLTALTVLASRLRDEQRAEIAAEIDQQLKGLKHHVERELTRTRIAASTTVTQRTAIVPIVKRLFATMEKLPRGDQIDWRLDCEADLVAPVEEADLVEILGNLLDNARKWARSEVRITARSPNSDLQLLVEDDGPGVPEYDRLRVMSRGTRLDESVPGTGLGLSITKSFVEAYGGELLLDSSERGGLAVRVMFPKSSHRSSVAMPAA